MVGSKIDKEKAPMLMPDTNSNEYICNNIWYTYYTYNICKVDTITRQASKILCLHTRMRTYGTYIITSYENDDNDK